MAIIKNDMKLLFQGDSLTDGNRYKEMEQRWDKNHQIGHSYVYVINALLGSLHPEMRLTFENRGLSGNGIKGVYERRHEDIFELEPDIFSILIGINDTPSPSRAPTEPETYYDVYSKLLSELVEARPAVKLVLLEPFMSSIRNNYDILMPYLSRFQGKVKRLADEYSAIFVPLQEKFNELCREYPPEYWIWDGVHTTENGNGIIARAWLEAVSPELCRIIGG